MSMDQPGKVANPAHGQLNRENEYFPVRVLAPENLVSRDGFGSPAPRQPTHLHTLAEPGPCLRDSSRVPGRRPFFRLHNILLTQILVQYTVRCDNRYI